MTRVRAYFDGFVKFFHIESWLRLLMLCVLVGIVTGLGGVAFEFGLDFLVEHLLKDRESGLYFMQPGSLVTLAAMLLVPGIGLFLAALVAQYFAPEAKGHGTDAVIDAFHHRQGQIRPRVPFIKGLCTIFTLGCGGSAGKEGPILQIGAGFGSFLSTKLGLSARDRRILMLAGCAGGLGAVLRAPLGSALFAAEMLYREPDFEHDVIIPGVISSVTAYSVFTAILGHSAIFQVPQALHYPSANGHMLGEFFHYALISVLCAVVAFVFVKSMRFFEHGLFSKLPLPALAKAGGGGMALGALASIVLLFADISPAMIMSSGESFLRFMLHDQLDLPPDPSRHAFFMDVFADKKLTLTVLGVAILAKILATGLTLGSGGSGGLLFPTLLIGAITGAAYAKCIQGLHFLPTWLNLTPEAGAGMIMVAMGGLFCGCTKTPIASLVMVSELTGSYGLAVPLMITCCSTYLLTTSFTINEAQVKDMAHSPAHRGDFLVNVLEDLCVRDAVTGSARPELIPADLPFNKVLERIKHCTASTFPIVDENGYLVGIFSLSDIRQIMNEQAVGNLVVAGDLGTTNVRTVRLDTDLGEALGLFTQYNINVLPVVEDVDGEKKISKFTTTMRAPRGMVGHQKVVAILTRQDLISAYRRKLKEIQDSELADSGGSNIFEDAQVSASGVHASPFPPPDAPPARTPASNPADLNRDIFKDIPDKSDSP
ncbi:MAG: chloride channel protein [Planctomycetota bacterium]|nr:chloride channel protein [Planctomycetota bacterium]